MGGRAGGRAGGAVQCSAVRRVGGCRRRTECGWVAADLPIAAVRTPCHPFTPRQPSHILPCPCPRPLQAGHITIWTDVDGVYSADPRKVPESVCLKQLRWVLWKGDCCRAGR